MEEDWEKTLILAVTFLLMGGFVISPKIRIISLAHYFTLFLILFFICLIQTHFLKKWADDEEKTDYNLAYWIYSLMSIVLFLYLIYILGLNPKLNSQKGGANMFDTNINITQQNEYGVINQMKNIANKGVNTVSVGISAYTNFWKSIFHKVFNKNNSYVE
jgi:Na+/proline symporter|tara:strand:+ start:732 stop:1211 length:480 start_codon:yes stop_codon:yes gene_type:complete